MDKEEAGATLIIIRDNLVDTELVKDPATDRG